MHLKVFFVIFSIVIQKNRNFWPQIYDFSCIFLCAKVHLLHHIQLSNITQQLTVCLTFSFEIHSKTLWIILFFLKTFLVCFLYTIMLFVTIMYFNEFFVGHAIIKRYIV